MSDLIDRQQAIDAVAKWIFEVFGIKESDGTATVFKRLRELPSIQPERETGHWVYRPEWSKYGDVWSCSECGEKTSQSVMGEPRFKYCPMCDAKMESGGEQE